MNIKTNDKVEIITGKDKGKKGKVLQVLPQEKKLVVEDLNLMIKHVKPRKQREKGQRIEFPGFINLSNVMLICPKCNKKTRVGYEYIKVEDLGKKKKMRKCKKCNETFE